MTTVWPPAYKIKRHRRAKHVRLRTSEPHGLVITIPHRFNVKHIPSILEENKLWIEKYLKKQTFEPDVLPNKLELKACNESWSIQYLNTDKKLALIERHHLKELIVVGNLIDKKIYYGKLTEWLKERAKYTLPILLQELSAIMHLNYSKVTIRDQKTLWGSCTVDKSINLNYKLLFLPRQLVNHVIIHELSHTVHLNHSAKFWSLVSKYDTSWQDNRRQLKEASQFIPKWTK